MVRAALAGSRWGWGAVEGEMEAEAAQRFNTRSETLQEVTRRATSLPCNVLLFQALPQFRSAEKLDHVSELMFCRILYRVSRNSILCSVGLKEIRLLYQKM